MKKSNTKDYADLLRQLETNRLAKGKKNRLLLLSLSFFFFFSLSGCIHYVREGRRGTIRGEVRRDGGWGLCKR